MNVGLAPSRAPNTTRPLKEQGRSRNDTAAPPTVCLSGLPYIDGSFHKERFRSGSSGSIHAASVWSSATLPATVCPSSCGMTCSSKASSSSNPTPRKSSASPMPRV